MKFIVKPKKSQFYNYCFCPTLFGGGRDCAFVEESCQRVCGSFCEMVGNGGTSSSHQEDMFGSDGLFGPDGLFGRGGLFGDGR